MARLACGPDEVGSRIADARRPGICYEGYVPVIGKDLEEHLEAPLRGVRVEAAKLRMRADMLEQPPRPAGILGRHDRHGAQDLNGPRAQVAQVAQRCRDDVQRGHAPPFEGEKRQGRQEDLVPSLPPHPPTRPTRLTRPSSGAA